LGQAGALGDEGRIDFPGGLEKTERLPGELRKSRSGEDQKQQ
jgi:hypothetical protein